MEQWNEILGEARAIIQQRGRVFARDIWMTGKVYYSDVWIHNILRRMASQGLLAKAPKRGGFILPKSLVKVG